MTKLLSGFCMCFLLLSLLACSQQFIAKNIQTGKIKSQSTEEDSSLKLKRVGIIPTNQEFDPDYIDFINDREGWLVIDKNLWHTDNEGKTWTLIYSLPLPHDHISQIEFVNNEVGWMSWNSGIYKTSDGGSTWSQLRTDKELVAFKLLPDGKHGWVAGGTYKYDSKKGQDAHKSQSIGENRSEYVTIFYTEDGGKNWKSQPIEQEEGYITNLYCLDAEHGWAFSNHSIFYLREGSWEKVNSSNSACNNQDFLDGLNQGEGMPRFGPIEIFFSNAETGWISFSHGNKAWTLATSKDGGTTWCDLPHLGDSTSTFPPFFKRIYFGNQTDGWGLDSHGAIYRTKDGGTTWSKLESDEQFLDMHFIDVKQGWVISKDALFRLNF